MPYLVRTFACEGCGEPVEKRAAKGAAVRCIKCAVDRSIENAYQQRAKCGEFYDRWAAAMKRAGDQAAQLSEIGREIDSIG